MKGYIGPKKTMGYTKKKLEKLMDKKSISTLQGELQKVFNEFIRNRDTKNENGKEYFICISCKNKKGTEHMHAGHYFSVGGHPSVRFDEDNTHGQCDHCNFFLHGNLIAYTVNLQRKIGGAKFEMLNIKARSRSKLMHFELEYLIEEYKTKIAALK